MRTLHLSAILAVYFILFPETARACSCGSELRTHAERRQDFSAVFHGKVTASEGDQSREIRWIRFAVIKDYSLNRGFVADTVTIWTAFQNSACGVEYPVGEEVLVFANSGAYPPGVPQGALVTGSCSRNIWGATLRDALRGMDEAVGVRSRSPRAAARGNQAVVECGRILFGGKAQANGALRKPAVRSAVSR